MPWGLSPSSAPSGGSKDNGNNSTKNATTQTEHVKPAISLKDGVIGHFTEAENWIAPIVAVGASWGLWAFWQRYLRRIPNPAHIPPSYFHRRGLFGKVTSVGDGDGFHLYHTPGGRLAGWGWLRRVPTAKKELKGNTISIRIAGVDAPEGAHFGKTAQPYAADALEFLDKYILNRRVRAYIYRKDQYDRIVASVHVRKPPFFLRKDVGLEMLKAGLAITYEAKFGAEFGGPKQEAKYKAAEALARQKGKGMWSLEKPASSGIFFKRHAPPPEPLESPMAYKKRMKALDEEAAKIAAAAASTQKAGTTTTASGASKSGGGAKIGPAAAHRK
ncbi:putative endonuclease LCL3 [Cladorrhinum sp. PSN259]|nr:putative endonuclease LCL3 [Cladorrhinum sp. PSN259]